MELPGKVLERIAEKNQEKKSDRDDTHSLNIKKHLAESFNKIKPTQGKNIVLVVGNAGAGKSTVINYLLGNSAEAKASPSETFEEKAENIGNDHRKLIIPQAYASEDGLVYCELPAITEANTKEERILTSVNTQLAIAQAKAVSAVVVVIDFEDFSKDKSDCFIKLHRMLNQLLKKSEKTNSSVFFMLNKIPKIFNQAVIHVVISSLTQELEKKLAAFNATTSATSDETNQMNAKLKVLQWMAANISNVIVFDDQQKNAEMITRLKSTTNKLRSIAFNFNNYSSERVEFNKVIYAIASEAEDKLHKKYQLEEQKELYQLELKERENDKQFYKQVICDIKNNDEPHSDQASIELLKKRINTLFSARRRYIDNIDLLREKIKSLKSSIHSFDLKHSQLYWQEKVYENNNFLDHYGANSLTFDYSGVSFLGQVDKYIKNSSKLLVQVEDANSGVFKATYHSPVDRMGGCCVKIYIMKKNRPDNAARVVQLSQWLVNLLKRRNQELNQEKEILVEIVELDSAVELISQSSVNNDQNAKKEALTFLQLAEKKHNEQIENLRCDMNFFESKLQDLNRELETHAELYNVVREIGTCLHFDSGLISSFIASHNQFSPPHKVEIEWDDPSEIKVESFSFFANTSPQKLAKSESEHKIGLDTFKGEKEKLKKTASVTFLNPHEKTTPGSRF